ncbi:hypothetical protein FQR65_LT16286 [Abscondita terminalis]|nr:hypothetical protein FQR65_LT16286 [Abscondita terminalis]
MVIHLAALAGVRPSIEKPLEYEEVNIRGTMNLWELCKDFGVSKFVCASSSSVYGNNEKVPFSETDFVDEPISPYAATKKMRENTLGHVTNGVTKSISYLHNHEGVYEILNLGESDVITLQEMVWVLSEELDINPVLHRLPMQAGDVQRTNADILKAKTLIGYQPMTKFQNGIKIFVEWFLRKKIKKIEKNEKDLKEVKKVVEKIKKTEPAIEKLSDDELREKTREFQQKIQAATANVRIGKILPEAFALLKETAKKMGQNGNRGVTASEERDRELAATKDFVVIEGSQAVWKNEWDAAVYRGNNTSCMGKCRDGGNRCEGKTLVGTLPVFLNALPGRGVHVVTVNDYLAKRDSAWMAPIFEFHGLSVDCIDNHQPNSESRRKAYRSNITYGTNNEFGFDYLRDNMVNSPEELVQGELNYAIVDEVDSVLVDDARTPLIISGPVPQGDRQRVDLLKPSVDRIVEVQKKTITVIFNEAKENSSLPEIKKMEGSNFFRRSEDAEEQTIIKFLSEEGNRALCAENRSGKYMADNNREMPKVDKDLYFVIDEKNNQVDLTDKGVEYMSQGNSDPGFFILPDIATEIAELEKKNLPKEEEFAAKEELYRDFAVKSERVHTLSQLLKAYSLFEKDDEYVVIDGEVKIVDEQTGRIWKEELLCGLHQAIEAKENVKIEAATQTFATITLQNYFRMYNKLAGMTGTAETEAGELLGIL